MNYRIQKLDAFTVIGRETELSNFQKRNVQISTRFWQSFNHNLKKAYLQQSGNWVKYAFTRKQGGRLFYFCGIPQRAVVPEGFECLPVDAQQYLVVEHIGDMWNIYDTYNTIYKEIIPNNGFVPCKDEFLHFERYDNQFQWNKENSVIKIYVPIH